jgi:hypothetical protein
MDVCIDIPHTNVVNKHVHHGELHENLFVDKIGGKKNLKTFSWHVILSQHTMTNAVHNSMIQKKKKKKMIFFVL